MIKKMFLLLLCCFVASSILGNEQALFKQEAKSLPLQKMLNAAPNGSVIKIPAGKFYIDTPTIVISNRKNITIQGVPGKTLLITKAMRNFFQISRTDRLTLKDFAVDYEKLGYIQTTVTKVNGKEDFTCVAHKGYPNFDTPGADKALNTYLVIFFDKDTRLMKTTIPHNYFKEKQKLSSTTVRISKAYRKVDYSSIRPGDFAVFFMQPAANVAVAYMSSNLRVENVTVYHSPHSVIISRFMSGDNYYRFKVSRNAPPPAGAVEKRLISSCADVFNDAFSAKGPTLDGCDFSFANDDCVNIHGSVYPIVKVESASVFYVATRWRDEFLNNPAIAGNSFKVRLLRNGTYEPVASAKVKKSAPAQHLIKENLLTVAHKKDWRMINQLNRIFYYRVELEKALAVKPSVNDIIDIPEFNGHNYRIKNCRFADTRGHGVLAMANNGIIENNTFERLKYAGIAVGNLYYHWAEAGWIQNVVIRNNKFSTCMDGQVAIDKENRLGVISVFGSAHGYGKLLSPYYRGNKNILIENNQINGSPACGIFVNVSDKVTIKNNFISNWAHEDNTNFGNCIGVKTGWGITIANSTGVKLENNRFGKAGKFSKGNIKDLGKDYTNKLFFDKK